MDIQELKLFKHLATTLHFGRTAQSCNITPSGLTRTIQRLEDELGKKLFLRDRRSVSLTEAGQKFSEYSDNALQLWNKLQSELSHEDIVRGELTLYCSVTAILSILPSVLEQFRATHPEVHINLQTGDAAMALSRLQGGEADIAVAALPDNIPNNIEFIKVIETPLIFISPKQTSDPDSSVDWNTTPLILAERGLSRKRAEAWFKKHKIRPNIYARVAGNEAIITLVSMGFGVGIVPELVLLKSPLRSQVTILTNGPRLKPFSVGICTTKSNTQNPIVRAFWQNVKEAPHGDLA